MQRYLIFLAMLVSYNVAAQNTVDQLTQYVEAARTQGTNPLPEAVTANVAGQEEAYLEALTPYLTDSVALVKYRAYSTLHRLAQFSPSQAFRQQTVQYLLEGVKDLSVTTTTSDLLAYYAKEDFTPAAKDTLVALVQREVGPYGPTIKLAGYLDLRQVEGTLVNNLLTPDKLNSSERWNTYLTLARLGEPNAISYLLRRVSSVEVNDDIIYEVYPDLAYTRQKELVDLMVATVMSDDTACTPANYGEGSILCAYRAMEYLPGVVEDFPWQRDVTGDLAVEDYETALTEIRQWFAANPEYQIDRSGFQ